MREARAAADKRLGWWWRYIPWWRLEPHDFATHAQIQWSEEAASTPAKSSERLGAIPLRLAGLPSTESDPQLQSLYVHCLENQIRPDFMWRMKTIDLTFVAGFTNEAQLSPEEKDKLLANALRARNELDRRDRLAGILISAMVGVAAALVTQSFL